MTDAHLAEAQRCTTEMRQGATREMRDLQLMLAERNIDAQRTACACAYDDLLDAMIFVLVLPNGEAIECSATYDDLDDPNTGPLVSTDWHRCPEGFYEGWIAAARSILNAEQGGNPVQAERAERDGQGSPPFVAVTRFNSPSSA